MWSNSTCLLYTQWQHCSNCSAVYGNDRDSGRFCSFVIRIFVFRCAFLCYIFFRLAAANSRMWIRFCNFLMSATISTELTRGAYLQPLSCLPAPFHHVLLSALGALSLVSSARSSAGIHLFGCVCVCVSFADRFSFTKF